MISRALCACLLVAMVGGLGCDQASLDAREEHVLNRIGFGPDAWSRQRIRALGIDAYVEEQLHPARLDDSALEARLREEYPALSLSLPQLVARYRFLAPNPNRTDVRRELSCAKLLRAVQSKRQLEQVLVEFWLDHFNVDARGEIAEWAIVPYERDVIRPHVLGRFEDLLRAVARHPAMLEYLDNAQNFREGFTIGRETFGVNENFARELLELHTVGPDAGQTLNDIRNVALAFTGWTVAEDLVGAGGGFEFLAEGHDGSEKRLLGLSLPAGGGIGDGNAVIRYLARHPDTAVQVAGKLCRLFVAEQATGCEVAAAARFLASDGDLREVVREILRSEPFRDPRYFRSMTKDPLRAIASTARAVGLRNEDEFADVMSREAARMGMELYSAPAPNGWPDDSRAWLGEGTLVRRWNVAILAAGGYWGMRTPASLGTADPQAVVTRVVDRLLLGGAAGATQAEILRHVSAVPPYARLEEATAMVLASPDFDHH